ncbi:hypothetical protein SPRG_05556 [Saprolegnia parasitica CBS 223.65]|uniref:Elicitin n=1 Tax=Saprolegnia parasitica (strain CBS 223.65) TaxID=695850 RepID=A0A067CGH5_SAPPC|nr:hypothetical protein SPRG_05556 [Saprolegnia parasitica CBS 223.65]KDO29603.1 hypothetical protein SPRG_05556 [Saprolegnia parasitica CBS 223.65]|eukprot:XP_012199663.1 hypothetical protein SPRG_05556 [Saprolegnia parasitica CBS 223.65]
MQAITTFILCAMAASTTAQSTPINHMCSDADLIAAITPVALTSATTLHQCAKDTGLSIEAVPVPANVTPAQVNALLQSSSCAAFYTSIQSAIAKISPACYLVTSPVPVTSAQISSVSYKDYVTALQGTTTGAPGTTTTKPSTTTAPTGNSTAAPSSSTTAPGTTTVAPGNSTLVPGNSTTAPVNSTTVPVYSTVTPITDTVVTKTPSTSATPAPTTTTPKATSSASILVPTLAALAIVAAATV